MWFRIEVDHNLFAGFVIYDKKAEKDARYEGNQVDEVERKSYGKNAVSLFEMDCCSIYCNSEIAEQIRMSSGELFDAVFVGLFGGGFTG